jgi:hypothetical protein
MLNAQLHRRKLLPMTGGARFVLSLGTQYDLLELRVRMTARAGDDLKFPRAGRIL